MISLLVFLLTAAIPGDPARAVLGKAATPSQLAAFRASHGLNAPLYTQYGRFLLHLFQGNLGTSFGSGQPVSTVIGARLARTFFLVLFAWLIAAAVAVPLGLWTGRQRGKARRFRGIHGGTRQLPPCRSSSSGCCSCMSLP